MKIKLELEVNADDIEQARDALANSLHTLDWAYCNDGSDKALPKIEADARAADGVYYDADCGKCWTSELYLVSLSR